MVLALVYHVIPQWKENEKRQRSKQMSADLKESYSSLLKNREDGVKPASIMHQIDHIHRLILLPEDSVDLLQEPNLEEVPCEIKPVVISLFQKCDSAYENGDIKQQDVEEAVKQLEVVLKHFYAEDMEEWKV
jgi:hypothetical protein